MSDASLHELLSAWLDGRLTGSDKVRAERLISEDPQCADLVRQWQSQREQIRELPRYRLNSDFAERVLAKVSLLEDAGRVSHARSTPVHLPPTTETTSYFATRSALTAITALAAMLLLTLFTLPMRVPNPQVAAKSRPQADAPLSLEVDPGGFVAADEVQLMPMKSGESELAGVDSRSDDAVAVESLVQTRDQLELRAAKGGASGELQGDAMLSQDRFGKESQRVANAPEQDAGFGDSRNRFEESDAATKQIADLPANEETILAQEKSDLGAQLANKSVPAEPLRSMLENETGTGDANSQSLSLGVAREVAAKDEVTFGMVPALQLSTNSVDEVWLIKVAEVPSLKKLEQAMRDNQIAFQTSSAPFGQSSEGTAPGALDADVQAIYVLTSPTQMQGAIAMLSSNAEINAFPLSLPNYRPGDVGLPTTRFNRPVDQAGSGAGLGEPSSQFFRTRRSFAQQLPNKAHMTASLDPGDKLEKLKSVQAGAKVVDEMTSSRQQSDANMFAGQPNPAAIPALALKARGVPGQPQTRPDMSPADAEQAAADRLADSQSAEGTLPWYAEEAKKTALRDAEQLAVQQTRPASATAEPESQNGNPPGEDADLQRYLLLIRFDPATESEAMAVPADAGK